MKPRKKWQPDYRFGGSPASLYTPLPLGQTHRIIVKRLKGKKR